MNEEKRIKADTSLLTMLDQWWQLRFCEVVVVRRSSGLGKRYIVVENDPLYSIHHTRKRQTFSFTRKGLDHALQYAKTGEMKNEENGG